MKRKGGELAHGSLIPDEYERRARLWPALLVSLPPTLAVLCWFPGPSWSNSLVAVIVPCGLLALFAQLGRDRGKLNEPLLFAKWGGKPSTQLLRFRSPHLAPATKERYHRKLQALVDGTQLPTPLLEGTDPAGADSAYDSFVAFLREATREKAQFPLVYAENLNYGFRRNLWGMRPTGIVLSFCGLIASLVATISSSTSNQLAPFPAAVSLLNGFMLAWWLLRITPTWVRLAAFAYAERLLATCDSLSAAAAQDSSERNRKEQVRG